MEPLIGQQPENLRVERTRRWNSAVFDLLIDLRQGLRTLRRDRAFTVLAVLTLALGIGATTAIYSVIDGVLLRPLPYEDADRLVLLRVDRKGFEGFPGLSAAEVEAFQEESELFESFARLGGHTIGLTEPGSMEQVPAVTASPELLPVLGVRPLLGRNFDAVKDHHTENGAFPSVLISHELWQRRYGSDPELVGRTIDIYNSSRQVIGIMPPGFRLLLGPGTNVAAHHDVWIPVASDESWFQVRAWKTLGRLKPGVTPRQAREELTAIGQRVRQRYFPESSDVATYHAMPLQDDLVHAVRPGVWILFIAAALVLLIGCVNVANLQLARGAGRRAELAVRASLGATRGRIVRQVVTENVLLGILGGSAGALVAMAAIQALRFLPADLPRGDEVALDASALAFALAVSVVAGILFGLIPAWQASRDQQHGLLRAAGRGILAGRLRSGLLISEVAISLVLLVGAGLLVRSLVKLQQVDLGFESANLLTMRISADAERYPEPSQRWQLFRRLLEELRSLPGVEAAGGIQRLPFQGTQWVSGWARTGESTEEFLGRSTGYDFVFSGYFETMGINLLAGRVLEDRDNEEERSVVVIDQELARRAWPGEDLKDAIGKELLVSRDLNKAEVIGVVETVRSEDPRQEPAPHIYFPFSSYTAHSMSKTLVLRTSGDPLALAAAAVAAIDQVGPGRPVFAVQTMDAYISETTAENRFQLILLGALALAALMLSTVGAFGVIAHFVSQRTREFGIRMALGAPQGKILAGVVRQGLKATAVGVLLGLLGALVLSRSLELLLFDVAPQDPLTLAVVSLALVAITSLACYVPARRATRVDPTVALRHE